MCNYKGEIVICQAKDGKTALEVKLQQGTVWLTQVQMIKLFDKDRRTIRQFRIVDCQDKRSIRYYEI